MCLPANPPDSPSPFTPQATAVNRRIPNDPRQAPPSASDPGPASKEYPSAALAAAEAASTPLMALSRRRPAAQAVGSPPAAAPPPMARAFAPRVSSLHSVPTGDAGEGQARMADGQSLKNTFSRTTETCRSEQKQTGTTPSPAPSPAQPMSPAAGRPASSWPPPPQNP